jgi:hypothetical protein
LEASWSRLNTSCSLLEPFGGLKRLGVVLEASWSLLKASWSRIKPPETNFTDIENVETPLNFIGVSKIRRFWEPCASWKHLGGILGRVGASWTRLGASWKHLGASWKRLGASWRRLGASWRRLGGVLERLGASWRRPEASWSPHASDLARYGKR